MKFKNESKFCLHGLNQEKVLNDISKSVPLAEVTRKSKQETTFCCSYFDRKKVEKILKKSGIKWEIVKNVGWMIFFIKGITSFGLIFAIILSSVIWTLVNQFVVQYEILGLDNLSETEIVSYIEENFSNKKAEIDTQQIEISLVEDFERISFASCIIKGQTLVINIKEKLLPEEMYGTFTPLTATKSGKITKIDLVSGTLCVQVGDFVQEGDVLVEPYVLDASGQLKKVEANAEIYADVYNVGSAEHYETQILVERTGNVAVENTVVLFGLSIYTFKEEYDFSMYEVEYEEVDLSKNLFLPFKIKKTYIYELKEQTIESSFDECREQVIENAYNNALKTVLDEEAITEEYYTIRHIATTTIVTYTIVTGEKICDTL